LIGRRRLLPSALSPAGREHAVHVDVKPSVPRNAARAAAPRFTERHFRDALAQFATGVTVITARGADGRFAGFTANSFNSVSLDPPLIVWSLADASETLSAFRFAGRYAVNVLAHDQIALAHRFSRPHADRFAGVAYRLGTADAPLIDGCIAWFECRHHAQHPAGDHTLFIGEVEHCERRNGIGLVFHHGHYATTRPLPDRAE
jgi:flavin reductase (DIM6/NTAB) family NADH-FMN oxidoreductase RutF